MISGFIRSSCAFMGHQWGPPMGTDKSSMGPTNGDQLGSSMGPTNGDHQWGPARFINGARICFVWMLCGVSCARWVTACSTMLAQYVRCNQTSQTLTKGRCATIINGDQLWASSVEVRKRESKFSTSWVGTHEYITLPKLAGNASVGKAAVTHNG